MKQVKVDGHEFKLIHFKGKEASRLGYRLSKIIGGVTSRVVASNDASEVQTVKDAGGNLNLSEAVDYLFCALDEEAFLELQERCLDTVLYNGAEFLKAWDNDPFNGDFGIALALVKEVLEYNFGFFSKVLADSWEKMTQE